MSSKFESAIMHQTCVNSLLRVIHIHDLLLVLFRSSTRMFVVLRTSLIWGHQYRPKGGRRALRPASDDRSRPRRTLRHTTVDTISLTGDMARAAPAYLDFTLYGVKCGSVIEVIDATSHLRTIAIDAVPLCKDFLVELCLLSSLSKNSQGGHNDPRLAFFLCPSFFRANETNTPIICTLSASARFRCSC